MTKNILAEWVCYSLRRALSSSNIKSGFKATGILLLNLQALDGKYGPSKLLVEEAIEEEDKGYDEEKAALLQEPTLPMEEPQSIDYEDFNLVEKVGETENNTKDSEEYHASEGEVPPIHCQTSQKEKIQPFIDYSKSLLLTIEDHIQKLQDPQKRRQAIA